MPVTVAIQQKDSNEDENAVVKDTPVVSHSDVEEVANLGWTGWCSNGSKMVSTATILVSSQCRTLH